MDTTNKIIFILVLVIATQLTRLLPLFFSTHLTKLVTSKRNRDLINEILFFILILYCFKDYSQSREYYFRIVVSLGIFTLQYWYKNTLASIFIGSAVYLIGVNL